MTDTPKFSVGDTFMFNAEGVANYYNNDYGPFEITAVGRNGYLYVDNEGDEEWELFSSIDKYAVNVNSQFLDCHKYKNQSGRVLLVESTNANGAIGWWQDNGEPWAASHSSLASGFYTKV